MSENDFKEFSAWLKEAAQEANQHPVIQNAPNNGKPEVGNAPEIGLAVESKDAPRKDAREINDAPRSNAHEIDDAPRSNAHEIDDAPRSNAHEIDDAPRSNTHEIDDAPQIKEKQREPGVQRRGPRKQHSFSPVSDASSCSQCKPDGSCNVLALECLVGLPCFSFVQAVEDSTQPHVPPFVHEATY